MLIFYCMRKQIANLNFHHCLLPKIPLFMLCLLSWKGIEKAFGSNIDYLSKVWWNVFILCVLKQLSFVHLHIVSSQLSITPRENDRNGTTHLFSTLLFLIILGFQWFVFLFSNTDVWMHYRQFCVSQNCMNGDSIIVMGCVSWFSLQTSWIRDKPKRLQLKIAEIDRTEIKQQCNLTNSMFVK